MRILDAIQWVIAHQELVFMFLGEFFAACWALVIACRPLIKLFVKLAEVTDNTWDNAAMKAVSDVFDTLAATLDRLRRKLPVHFGPSTSVQPITTKETRAAASLLPLLATPIPPLESKRPPPPADTLPGPPFVMDDSQLQRPTIPEEPKP